MALLMDQSRSVLPLRSANVGDLESCGGKNVRARLGPFHLNWPEPVLFGRPDGTSGKRPKSSQLCNKVLIKKKLNFLSAGMSLFSLAAYKMDSILQLIN